MQISPPHTREPHPGGAFVRERAGGKVDGLVVNGKGEGNCLE